MPGFYPLYKLVVGRIYGFGTALSVIVTSLPRTQSSFTVDSYGHLFCRLGLRYVMLVLTRYQGEVMLTLRVSPPRAIAAHTRQ